MSDSLDSSDALRDAQARERVSNANKQAMFDLLSEFSLRLCRDIKDWRPCERTRGDILGIASGVEILATDGVAGFFLRPDGSVLYGHIQHFTGEVKPLFSVPKPAAEAKPKPGKTKKQKQDEKNFRAAMAELLS